MKQTRAPTWGFRNLCIMLALITMASALFMTIFDMNTAVISFSATSVSRAEPRKLIALTFDDGPYLNITSRILDTLEKNSAKATFFIVGSRVSGREEILIRMEKLGCEIGNHTYSHADLTRLSKERCTEEIELANKEFERVVGHGAKLVRPPYGFYNKFVRDCLTYPLVLWTIDTNDWKPRNADELADYVISVASDGSIILMHDEQSSTIAALEKIIPELTKAGYEFVTVSELIESIGDDCTAYIK